MGDNVFYIEYCTIDYDDLNFCSNYFCHNCDDDCNNWYYCYNCIYKLEPKFFCRNTIEKLENIYVETSFINLKCKECVYNYEDDYLIENSSFNQQLNKEIFLTFR